MHKLAIAAALALALTAQARAGSLSYTATTAAGATTYTVDVADADIARIITAFRAAHNIPSETSSAEVTRLIIRAALDQMLAQTVAIESQRAADDARQAVSPIVATPQ